MGNELLKVDSNPGLVLDWTALEKENGGEVDGCLIQGMIDTLSLKETFAATRRSSLLSGLSARASAHRLSTHTCTLVALSLFPPTVRHEKTAQGLKGLELSLTLTFSSPLTFPPLLHPTPLPPPLLSRSHPQSSY